MSLVYYKIIESITTNNYLALENLQRILWENVSNQEIAYAIFQSGKLIS